MSKVGVFFVAGFETIEALTPVDILRRAGVEVVMVSVTGEETIKSSHGVSVKMDIAIEQLDFDSLDMIVLPGGPGTVNLEASKLLSEKILEFNSKGRRISAICAAPRFLGKLGILEGKRACVYPGNEEFLKGAKITINPVEVDGTIITARGMGCSIDFSLAIVETLCNKEKAEEIGKAIIYL